MKPVDEHDPYQLVAVNIAAGDADHMAECVVEEFVLAGWSERQLLSLFTCPDFRLTHQIYVDRGHAYVCALIERVQAQWTPTATGDNHG